MITVHDIEQGSPEWLQLRADLYTGQNADKLLSYHGSVKIVDGVVSSYALTEITGFSGNFYTRRGHKLEDEALDLYEQITGHKVSRPGFVTNSKWPSCGFSPDGHDDDLGIPLEVKAFEKVKHLKMFNGDIPLKVQAQMYFGQFIWEKKGGRLIIYNPDFAKKMLIDELGIEYPNPDYDPAKAIKIIDIKFNRNIMSNFRRILTPKEVVHG